MKLADISQGPMWLVYIVVGVLFVLSFILISGHGSNMITPYNALKKETREKFDDKLVCRAAGIGLLIIDLLILFAALFQNILPANFSYILVLAIFLIAISVIFYVSLKCRKSMQDK